MSRKTLLALVAVTFVGNASLAMAGLSAAHDVSFPLPVASQPSVNFLDVRQYRVDNARVPGMTTQQTVTAWQVISGTWNGQSLGGLSLVLVEQNASEGRGVRTFACYVSEFASPAQREALLAAMQSTHPNLRDIGSVRIEPAVIRIDVDSQNVTIHVGQIA